MGGFSDHASASGTEPKLSLFYFPSSHPTQLNTADYWLGIRTDKVQCFDKLKSESLHRYLGFVINGLPVLFCFFLSFLFYHLSVFCFFLSLLLSPPSLSLFVLLFLALWKPRAQSSLSSCHLPPESQTNLAPTRPTPADVPEWTVGLEGARGQSRQRERHKHRKKPLALAIMVELTLRDSVCVYVCVHVHVSLIICSG